MVTIGSADRIPAASGVTGMARKKETAVEAGTRAMQAIVTMLIGALFIGAAFLLPFWPLRLLCLSIAAFLILMARPRLVRELSEAELIDSPLPASDELRNRDRCPC